MFVDSENCSLIQKYFMSTILISFSKVFICLGVGSSSGSMRFAYKVLNVPLRNKMTRVACTGELIALGFTASNAL